MAVTLGSRHQVPMLRLIQVIKEDPPPLPRDWHNDYNLFFLVGLHDGMG